MYKSGSGVPRDLEYAARLFRRACDQGEALACYSLGYMYANGEGVDRDIEHAGRLFRTRLRQRRPRRLRGRRNSCA